MRWVACFLWLLWLATACVLEDRPIDMQGDGGNDAGLCGGCPDAEPVCTEDLECVQCTADDDGYCTASAQVCDTDSSTCVQCVGDSDCTAAGAGRCDAHECKPCNDHSQCSDIDGLPVGANACDDGLCVDCTPATEAQTCANDKSCDPRTRACTDTTVASLDTCEACVADSECGDNGAPSTAHHCVPMSYDGERFPNDETGFCLKTTLGGCEQPYSITLFNRPSLSEPTGQENYCGINEVLTTCPAVKALVDNQPCPIGTADECPVGGLCRQVGDLVEDRCTYPCADVVECKNAPAPGSTCGSSGSGGDDYCGG
jgi:hypothetical protein